MEKINNIDYGEWIKNRINEHTKNNIYLTIARDLANEHKYIMCDTLLNEIMSIGEDTEFHYDFHLSDDIHALYYIFNNKTMRDINNVINS